MALRLPKKLFTLSTIAAALFAGFASADTPNLPTFTGGGGVYLSFVLGETMGIGYGVEAFGTFLLNRDRSCESDSRWGIGPKLQFGAINFGRPRLVVAVHGGTEFTGQPRYWVDGEGGLTLRFGKHQGGGVHTGVAFGAQNLAYMFAKVEYYPYFEPTRLMGAEASVGVGASIFTPFGRAPFHTPGSTGVPCTAAR